MSFLSPWMNTEKNPYLKLITLYQLPEKQNIKKSKNRQYSKARHKKAVYDSNEYISVAPT